MRTSTGEAPVVVGGGGSPQGPPPPVPLLRGARGAGSAGRRLQPGLPRRPVPGGCCAAGAGGFVLCPPCGGGPGARLRSAMGIRQREHLPSSAGSGGCRLCTWAEAGSAACMRPAGAVAVPPAEEWLSPAKCGSSQRVLPMLRG